MEFALFDRWYAAVPGPTEVNRLYANSATSDGCAANDDDKLIEGYPQRTIFESIDESSMNKTWGVYFEIAPTTLFFKYTRREENLRKFHDMTTFWDDVSSGTLPNYVWIEPNYYDEPNRPANDQHPDHDVAAGDLLFKQVYEALRNGPLWNSTLFIITYDEHGGFFDHVGPPADCPNPDNKTAYDVSPPFDFTRLGVRVPTLMISPWIPKGTVVSEPINGTHFEHSSFPATIRKWFAADQPTLTARDAWASTFDFIVDSLDAPRTDCPTTIPVASTHRAYNGNGLLPFEQIGQLPITGFQESIVKMCAALRGVPVPENLNEMEAARFCELPKCEGHLCKLNDGNFVTPSVVA